jgi:rhodanese-related sulfurtransferase
MIKRLIIVAAGLMLSSTVAFALTLEEQQSMQKAADSYLSGIPAGEYHIMAEKLLERINSGKQDFVIVDVRSPKDKNYDLGHIPGAIPIAFKDAAKPENLAKLPKDKDIIVYCNTGHDENKVLTVLRMLGYRAYGLKWGYMSWKTATPTGLTLKAIDGSILNNYPVEK